jgi:hypothetical protein
MLLQHYCLCADTVQSVIVCTTATVTTAVRLRPGGLMFPSHATMYWGLVSDEEDRLAKQAEYLQSTQEWHRCAKL